MDVQIQALVTLQNLDISLAAIAEKKGELPKRLAQLEADLAELEGQKDKRKQLVAKQEEAIESFKEDKKNAEVLIRKYRDEQMSAADSRDYDKISKDIALQELEMQLAQKNVKTAQQIIKEKKEQLTKIRAGIREKKEGIKTVKEELSTIEEEVQEQEKKLQEDRPKAIEKIDKELYAMYDNMRKKLVPSYVITEVRENACGGCFHIIPLQQQVVVLEKKKMVQCEYCNRILADVIQPEPVTKKKKKEATK